MIGKRRVLLILFASFALLGSVIALNEIFSLPGEMTIRIFCAGMCLFFIYELRNEYRGESWPQISFWIAVPINVGLFFTPLLKAPLSRKEFVIFALANAIIVLLVRIPSYHVEDDRQRAVWQQMVLALIVFVVLLVAIAATKIRST